MTRVVIITLTGDTGKNERAIQTCIDNRWAEGRTFYAATGIRDGIALFFERSSLRLEQIMTGVVEVAV